MSIHRSRCAVAGAVALLAAAALSQTPVDAARRLVRQFELPAAAMQAARELTQLGSAAVEPLRTALADPRPEVVAWALWTCEGLGGAAELKEPIRALTADKDLRRSLPALRALVAIEGEGETWLADYHGKTAIAVPRTGEARTFASFDMVMSCSRLPGGGALIAAYGQNRVVELDAAGEEVWAFGEVRSPSDAERLPDGNTLVADSSNGRVIEVSRAGGIAWSYDVDVRPIDVDRLANGNTLIASYHASGVVEVDRNGVVVWKYEDQNPRDADRLPDGTTLVTLTDQQRVVVVDSAGVQLREWKFDFDLNDAELLPDGHLLVAGEGKAVELDADGHQVWTHALGYAGRVARYGPRIEPRAAGDAPRGR